MSTEVIDGTQWRLLAADSFRAPAQHPARLPKTLCGATPAKTRDAKSANTWAWACTEWKWVRGCVPDNVCPKCVEIAQSGKQKG